MLREHECESNKEVYDVKQVENSVPTWRNLFYYGKSWVGKSSNGKIYQIANLKMLYRLKWKSICHFLRFSLNEPFLPFQVIPY